MDQLVDLDAVGAELRARCAGWGCRGLKVGAFTWRDAEASWPQPIVTNGALVADPESLGMTMEAAPGHYAELVLWCGGWADLGCLIDGEILMEGPHYRDTEECVAVAERLAARLLSGTLP